MEILVHVCTTYPFPKLITGNGFDGHKNSCLISVNALSSSSWLLASKKLSPGLRKSVIVGAKNNKKKKKYDTHSFVPKPDEATGPFPEALLLKKKKVEEDGKLLPDFADAEEEELFEFLNLQLQSQLKVDQMRHYEVVYLIHEKHAEEIGSVNEKVQDFLREKNGKIWRQNDWGMRRLAYKIQKAKNAHYILMNFELESKWINDFKSMLDKDERVIRHLVIKRDEAITEDCPPPPEFHTMRAGMDDYEEEDDLDYDDDEGCDEDWEGEDEVEVKMDGYNDDMEDGTIAIGRDDNGGGAEDRDGKLPSVSDKRRKNQTLEKAGR